MSMRNISLNLSGTDSFLFDLDGTLWDSTEEITKAWNLLLETKDSIKRPPITREELFACMGLPMYDIAARLFPDEAEKVRNDLMDEMGIFENGYLAERGAQLYEGIPELIEKLNDKMPLFIVSNCQSGYIEAFLKAHKFEKYFADIECWGNTKKTKGENIADIVKRNKLKSPVYLGDTQGDAYACSHAGVPFVFASYGFGKVDDHGLVVKKPLEVMDILGIK
ncbi:MAG: HAD family hydrolase [Clostridiales bacterium]|nr:HAD family hydrolase [Clostridiales bacterium]